MTTHRSTGVRPSGARPLSPTRLRALGIAWLAAGALVTVPALMLTFVSDRAGDRGVGVVLMLLVASAAGLGTWLTASPAPAARRISLVVSGAWLVAAAFVYPTQDFTADAVWAAGVPAVCALVTGVLGWVSGRSR